MRINIDRLMSDIERYGTYGLDPKGGLTRPSFSEPDYQVRELFMKELKEMGLAVYVDPIANIWGRWSGEDTSKKSIVIGSHLDTVPNGGMFDGALGVLVAKEIMKTIIEHEVPLKHTLEIVSFTAEEPNDFNLSTMGSRTFTGKLTKEDLMTVTDSKGTKLKDAVEKAGGSLERLPIEKDDIAAFVELHIEQGKQLESAELPVGVVDRIVGIYRDKVTIIGESNHSGTTMMNDRFDALTAASEMILAVETILRNHGTDAVATIGKLDVFPNAANIIPGKVDMVLEIRSGTAAERIELKKMIYQKWDEVIDRRKVSINVVNILDQQECQFDEQIVQWIQESAKDLQIPYTTFSSMAGHDATHMADVAKTAMIFVKSINGKSHCPEEFSKKEDIEQAANVMLNAVLNIDQKLS
ncbi:Zn-dependent hydrolase [Siminovitchia sp. FSL H7-0308]|uniref:Zn-dependent hydrolase n=1 Tax=Siminovitchia sp. FSL H7-0308 TaxID=2921432 RepID=UPI0030EB1D58